MSTRSHLDRGTDYFACRHHNFNVVAMLDNTGAVVERYDYNPYGKRFVLDPDYTADADGISDVGLNFGHQGLYHDEETDLQIQRPRPYSVQWGRFLNRSHWGYIQGRISLYDYEKNTPTRYTEPFSAVESAAGIYTGEAVIGIIGGTGATIGAVAIAAGAGVAIVAGGIGYGLGTLIWPDSVETPTLPPRIKCSSQNGGTNGTNPGGSGKGPKKKKKNAKKPEPDIIKKINKFGKKSLKDQIKEYNTLKKTYQKHLNKYGQQSGKTTGETNRMERELAEMENILNNRGKNY